eukprot:jgi/Chlat1/7761/Chrsp66S00568
MKPKKQLAIVVGAGVSGLAAARRLQEAEWNVIVLEARDRLGGRVHTDTSMGWPVDLGASWVHGASPANPVMEAVWRLRMPAYCTSGDDSILYDHDLDSYILFDVDGTRIPREVVAQVSDLFENMLQQVEQLRNNLPDVEMSLEGALAEVVLKCPQFNVEGMHKRVLQWFVCRMEGWFAADISKLSFRYWDEEELLPGGHALMVRGYAPFIASLAKGLDVRLRNRVISIAYTGDTVHVTTERGRTLTADAVVVSLPLGVLKAHSVRFEPHLPPWKQRSIQLQGVGIENKIVLKFPEAFWPNVDFLGVVAPTPNECSYFLNLHRCTGHPFLVQAYVVSAIQTMLPGIKVPEPLDMLVSRWFSDPDSRGTYTFDAVGSTPENYDRLAASVGRLHFAGEATSRHFPGTVHGAFVSGIRAAQEIIKEHTALPLVSETVKLQVEPIVPLLSSSYWTESVNAAQSFTTAPSVDATCNGRTASCIPIHLAKL